MTTTLKAVEEQAAAIEPVPTVPHVLPKETPLEMPEQDLAISPVVTKVYRLIRTPGHALRSALTFKRLQTQDAHHDA